MDMSFETSKELIIEFGRILAKNTVTEALQGLTLMTVFLIDKTCEDNALKLATAQQIAGEVKTALRILDSDRSA